MKKDNPDSVANATKRLNAIGEALKGWCSTLETVAGEGRVNSSRQVKATIGQLETFAKGAFQTVAKKFDANSENQALSDAAKSAESACLEVAKWLRDSYLPKSTPKDGVGEERCKMWARHFTGADLNLRDTYEWGIAQLDEINARMKRAAERPYPDATSLREVGGLM